MEPFSPAPIQRGAAGESLAIDLPQQKLEKVAEEEVGQEQNGRNLHPVRKRGDSFGFFFIIGEAMFAEIETFKTFASRTILKFSKRQGN